MKGFAPQVKVAVNGSRDGGVELKPRCDITLFMRGASYSRGMRLVFPGSRR